MRKGMPPSKAAAGKWRFTWEAQSHSPTLKLFLFDSQTMPSLHCANLSVQLNLPESQLLVTWIAEGEGEVFVRVPVPRVLIDHESPVSFRVLDDHVEVRLVLLLPVDHPIVSNFDSVPEERDCGGEGYAVLDDKRKPLVMESDLKSLSSSGEAHFYCRSCSARLTTTPPRSFVELPSVNWRELADNWFGGCCCSFGGVSEKLVNIYAESYTCARGVCLLDATTVTLCKDDLVGWESSDFDGTQKHDSIQVSGYGNGGVCNHQNGKVHDLVATLKEEDAEVGDGCCSSTCHGWNHVDEVGAHDGSKPSLVEWRSEQVVEVKACQRSFLNGYLGNTFMARSYNLSMDIEWRQFVCPECSSILGAYPCHTGDAPIDDGVRLFKCYISTSLPVGRSSNLFRKYTLERMLACQLMELAKDELSFRTVVRDLAMKTPMLQIVLLNPNSWSCSGHCMNSEGTLKSDSNVDLQPVIKVLFSDCSNKTEFPLRLIEDLVKENRADEAFMLRPLIDELNEILVVRKESFPPSCASLQGLNLSSLSR